MKSMKPIWPSKKYDGKVIAIRALENCLDYGSVITGIYRHIQGAKYFHFIMHDPNRAWVLSRDEWEVAQ